MPAHMPIEHPHHVPFGMLELVGGPAVLGGVVGRVLRDCGPGLEVVRRDRGRKAEETQVLPVQQERQAHRQGQGPWV